MTDEAGSDASGADETPSTPPGSNASSAVDESRDRMPASEPTPVSNESESSADSDEARATPPAPDAPASPDEPRGRWAHIRAGLVAAHIFAVLVLAVPDAGGVAQSRSAWKNPTVQAELSAWAERLNGLGLSTDAASLEANVFSAAKTWTDVLKTVRTPVQPYSDVFGVRQTWRMFVAPHRHPVKLHIDLELDGEWRPVQIARSDEHGWRAHQFDHVRVRSLLFRYGWKRYAKHYQAFARWVAARAAQDFPTATRIRLRMYGFRTPTPQEVRDDAIPEGKFRPAIVLPLEDFR